MMKLKKPNFKGMSKKKKVLLLIIILVVIAGGAFVIKNKLSAPVDTETYVETAVAERTDIAKTISSEGEVVSSLDEKLNPRTGYKLKKMKVAAGEAVKEGEIILSYTNGGVMKAPYDLVVKNWNLPDEKKAITNDHYVEVSGTEVMKVELAVKEKDVLKVTKGDPATITVDAVNKKFNGEVSFISDVGTYEGGTSSFKVEVLFNNNGKVKLGMNCKAKVILEEAKNVIVVPKSAVMDDGESKYVMVVDGEETKEVTVTTGIKNKENIEIKSGLKEGDEVQLSEE